MTSTILQYQHFFLIGIKGVAMTSLAQCLTEAGKKVSGSDVAEDFVTAPILKKLNIPAILNFEEAIPADVDCVIYTAAHQAQFNPQVQQAQQLGLPILTHAAALGELFNQQPGIAVCGVGGKSTVSAMLAWTLTKMAIPASFSVGVGDIIGLGKTGQWDPKAELFVAEADDYVTDPTAPQRGEPITPRFSFLYPQTIVCTNLKYDHPDVYQTFDDTLAAFGAFFKHLPSTGTLVINGDDQPLVKLAQSSASQTGCRLITFGESDGVDVQLLSSHVLASQNNAEIKINQDTYQLTLSIPGKHNLLNALASVAAAYAHQLDIPNVITALSSFQSTKRRFEFVGEKHGILFYDDYAHHPHEVAAAVRAVAAWHPDRRIVVAFQSHTFSRTKQLFGEFVDALSLAQEVVLIDIFASAREAFDPTVSSDQLVSALHERRPDMLVQNLHTISALADYCHTELHAGDVFITLGAGDIYQVHDLITDND
jgi:UDP-N-acetylmuramate--alanine ligase